MKIHHLALLIVLFIFACGLFPKEQATLTAIPITATVNAWTKTPTLAFTL